MLERTLRYFLLLALIAGPLTGCGYLTQNGRQQMAYQRYVKKMSGRSIQQKKKFKAPKMPLTPQPSDNKVDTKVMEESGPQSVHSGESQENN